MRHPAIRAAAATAALIITTCALGAVRALADDPPPLPEPERLSEKVLVHDVTLEQEGRRTRLWIYLPADGAKKAGSLPCVLIAPAGTRLWHGIGLAEGDRPEHLPWVEAGFCVVAYSVAEPLPDEPSDEQIVAAVEAFLAADGGLADAKGALDYALARVPAIDPERVIAAGHSSAATLALQAAAKDPRIKACAAFAPVTDLAARLKDLCEILASDGDARLRDWVAAHSPLARADALGCPTFLFHAEDDRNVPVAQTLAFAERLRASNERVTARTVPAGGHYKSMIEGGLAEAIRWASKLGR